jgi:tRNA dimethylallyltransferase
MKYIIICGPTCSGKTSLGVDLALRFNGEIISADSRQIYMEVSIGTAKPRPVECRGINYHLIDFLDLDQQFSAHQFAVRAAELVKQITAEGKVPFVVGGTGLYIEALTKGLFDSPEPNHEYRRQLEEMAGNKGTENLHKMLAELDPVSAARIKPNDQARLIRALEIFKLTGQPISALRDIRKPILKARPLWIGLTPIRRVLYEKINDRVDKMIEEGLEQEILGLINRRGQIQQRKLIGYAEMAEYLFDNKVTKSEAIDKFKQRHRNYAKRQLTWFKKVPDIAWFDPNDEQFPENVVKICDDYLKNA